MVKVPPCCWPLQYKCSWDPSSSFLLDKSRAKGHWSGIWCGRVREISLYRQRGEELSKELGQCGEELGQRGEELGQRGEDLGQRGEELGQRGEELDSAERNLDSVERNLDRAESTVITHKIC